MAPILERVAQDYSEQLELVKVDSDVPANEELLRQYDVMSIPTLVLLNEDREVLGKQVGQKSELALREWLDINIQFVEGVNNG
jgi:thioredoxin-like negative regulator of GroEL